MFQEMSSLGCSGDTFKKCKWMSPGALKLVIEILLSPSPEHTSPINWSSPFYMLNTACHVYVEMFSNTVPRSMEDILWTNCWL